MKHKFFLHFQNVLFLLFNSCNDKKDVGDFRSTKYRVIHWFNIEKKRKIFQGCVGDLKMCH